LGTWRTTSPSGAGDKQSHLGVVRSIIRGGRLRCRPDYPHHIKDARLDIAGGVKKSIDALNRFTTQVDKLGRKRNRVIHDPWVFRTRTIEEGVLEVQYGRHEISADRKLVYEIKVESHGHVLKIAHEAIAARKRFMDLYASIQAELKAQNEELPGTGSGSSQGCPPPESGG
jgi:hypothetical protein